MVFLRRLRGGALELHRAPGHHWLDTEALQRACGFFHLRRAPKPVRFHPFAVVGKALSWECAAAAEAAGVLDEVAASLDASEKPLKWAERIAYNRERMETHGARRAAEMEESARTLQGLGVEPVMTRGTVARQRQAAKSEGN